MEVILQKDVDRLGKAFEVKSVKDGYAINFLLPQKLAVIATEGKKKRIEQDRKAFERKEAARVKDASATAKKLEELSLTITMKAGDEDKLYGSVTSQVVADKLNKEGFAVNKKDVLLDEPIKALGVYTVKVNLHHSVSADVKVWVVKEGKTEEEAAPAPAPAVEKPAN
jgi:large subunit ribosomal protein L9